MVSECLSQAWAIVAACVVGDQTFGPHSPVRLIVKANSRTIMVRQLKVPVGFGANLPFGPLPLAGCPRVLCEKLSEPTGLGRELCATAPGSEAAPCDRSGSDNFDNGDSRSLAELGKDYNGLMMAIEDELCTVEGLDGLQSQARKGRATGAHFCWTSAMGDDTAGSAKTTSVSRAWRRTAKLAGRHPENQARADS